MGKICGASERDRTSDLLITNQLSICPVGYRILESLLVHLQERWGDDGSGAAGGGRFSALGAAIGAKADSPAVSHGCHRLCLISPNVA